MGSFSGSPASTRQDVTTDKKKAVRVATVSNLADLTNVSVSDAAFDGVTLAEGDRVLLLGQTSAAERDIRVCGQVSGGYAELVRAADFDADAEINSGCLVTTGGEGATLAYKLYILTASDPITLGTTSLTWTDATGSGGTAITSLTGDVTASGPGAAAATLANSGVSAGSYGSGSAIPVITVDAKGRITSASTSALSDSGVVAGSYGSASLVPVITVDAKGRVTAASTASISSLSEDQAILASQIFG